MPDRGAGPATTRPDTSSVPTLEIERGLWAAGVRYVAGVDEVGRGPLAGPVVAAAVVFAPEVAIEGVQDSKLLSRERRAVVEGSIRAGALAIGLGVVEVGEIDRRNILQATLEAMRLAVDALGVRPDHVLVDGNQPPRLGVPVTLLVGGDRTAHAIAAASIVAKEHRDRLMRELDLVYPGYGFARHVGYGTREHLEALHRLGPCPAHRRSFAPVRRLLDNVAGEDPGWAT